MKRAIACIVMFMSAALLSYGNIHIVHLDKLPNDETLHIHLERLVNIVQYIDHYSPEWNYPVDKNEVIDFLTGFRGENSNLLTSHENYELRALNIVIMSYLYNLDILDVAEAIAKEARYLKTNYPDEYRTYWLYGNFLIHGARIPEGFNEFKHVLETDGNFDRYPVDFLHDYGYACLLAGLYKNSMYVYELAAARENKDVLSNRYYTTLSEIMIASSPGEEYTQQQVWKIIASEGQYYARSRMLGALLPLKETWNLQFSGLQNESIFCFIGPDKFIPKNGNQSIGVSILLQFFLSSTAYENFLNNFQASFPVIARTQKVIGDREYDILTYEDLEKYQHMGGSRGYYISTVLRYPQTPGIGIELPLDYTTEMQTGNPQYYPLTQELDRINQDIYMGVLLDSCNDIFEESSDFLFTLLQNSVFE
jgi:hypothetical protein